MEKMKIYKKINLSKHLLTDTPSDVMFYSKKLDTKNR